MYAVDLMPLFISLFFLAVVVLWFSVQNYKNVTMTAVIIPLTLLATVVSYMTVDKILGYPIKAEMADDSLYLSHIESQDNERIFVWIIEPGSTKPRSVSIANTDNNRKAMSDAKAKTEKGVKQKMKLKASEWERKADGEEAGNNGMTPGGEYEIYDFTIRGGSLKQYNPNAGLPEGQGEFDSLPSPTPIPQVDPNQENPGAVAYEDLPQLEAPENPNPTPVDVP